MQQDSEEEKTVIGFISIEYIAYYICDGTWSS